jgi:hypothetical protein
LNIKIAAIIRGIRSICKGLFTYFDRSRPA